MCVHVLERWKGGREEREKGVREEKAERRKGGKVGGRAYRSTRMSKESSKISWCPACREEGKKKGDRQACIRKEDRHQACQKREERACGSKEHWVNDMRVFRKG